ncbi:MAG: hypothetical protein P4L84_23855 [Isosphaeraceae bacterium]|nr:hypothetical protein [Isosphaeraceae bacterium]
MTVGPDGNLWFPAESENRIGQITSSGVITAVTFPLTGYTPVGVPLINGADGDLWFIAIPREGRQGAFQSDVVRVNLAPVPVVDAVSRSGFHMQPTRLLLTFNRPMDPAAAQNVGNYTIIPVNRQGRPLRRRERPIAIEAATYNSGTYAVTLTTARRLNVQRYYELTVNAAAPSGLADMDGTPLGGAGAGPFQAVLHGFSEIALGRATRSAARGHGSPDQPEPR